MSGRVLRRVRETVFTLVATLGLLCLLSTGAALALDVRPVVFLSGSMSPAIDTGALGFSRTVPAADVAVGDVVTVTTSTGLRVTHRVENVAVADGTARLVLRGDANRLPDDEVYTVDHVDRVFADVPRLGYVVSALSGPAGTFAGGLVVGLVLLLGFRRPARRDDDDPAPPAPRPEAPGAGGRGGARRASRRGVAASLAGTLALGSLLVGSTLAQPTLAAYADSVRVAGGTFTAQAVELPGPTQVRCRPGPNAATVVVSWAEVPGATGYTVEWRAGIGLGGTSTTDTVGPSARSSSRTFTATQASTYSVVVRATGAAGGRPAATVPRVLVARAGLGPASVTTATCLSVSGLGVVLPSGPTTPGEVPSTDGAVPPPAATGSSDGPGAPSTGAGDAPADDTPVDDTPEPPAPSSAM